MGIFEKENGSNNRRASKPAVSDQINMVGNGTVFEGTLRAKSDVRVSGTLIGTLDVEGRVLVSEEGAVEGDIRATNADIAGSVQGKLEISERLVLKSSARVDGELHTERLVVEEGAHFSGTCHMGSTLAAGPSKDAPAAKSARDDAEAKQTKTPTSKKAPAAEKVEEA